MMCKLKGGWIREGIMMCKLRVDVEIKRVDGKGWMHYDVQIKRADG